jgi:uncharacterized membrane protein YiaA
MINRPSYAFVGASWLALGAGMLAYNIGLWNAATLALSEKGYYFTVLMFGLFAAISIQKSVRDKLEGIPVTNIYYGVCWFAALLSITLLAIGLWNATSLTLSEKGFYAISFLLSMFAVIVVQKNTRDLEASSRVNEPIIQAQRVIEDLPNDSLVL